jgi:hypothetical protein
LGRVTFSREIKIKAQCWIEFVFRDFNRMCDLCTSKFDVSSRSAFEIATAPADRIGVVLHNIFWCYRNVDYCRNDYDFNFCL